MTGLRQTWLVARREMVERARSRAFQAGLVIMMVVVVGVIVVPSLMAGTGTRTADVGVTAVAPAALGPTIQAQGRVVDVRVHLHRFETQAAGEAAVRDGKVDVLVVGDGRLEWRRQVDGRVEGIVASAIQVVAIRERAAATGLDPDRILGVVAPVRVTNVELGAVQGRSPGDEAAAMLMTVLLLMVLATYGNLVLSGVVEEKTSRVVEVLLARIPPRNLLAGKVVGIGLLGLVQVGITAVAAIIATVVVDSLDVPAIRAAVIVWAVVWFVLGYALYAMAYGTLGSLATRTEDAQSVAGPVQVVLIAGYFAAFASIASPDALWSRAISFFPPTAPLVMPNRIAMGAATWWEPVAAAALTIAAVAGLVLLGGRVYTAGILHSGPTLKLRQAWRGGPDAR